MMILHWSPRSPFVHKVMVALEETGLRSQVELTRSVVPTDDPNHVIWSVNPLGQIPTLVLDDGRVLYDSTVICMYLDQHNGKQMLLPENSGKRLDVLHRHALGNSLIEEMVLFVIERHTPPEKQTPGRLERYALKLAKTLARLEAGAEFRNPDRFDLGDIAIASALAYVDFRKLKPGWQAEFPITAAWYERTAQRPSMLAAGLRDG